MTATQPDPVFRDPPGAPPRSFVRQGSAVWEVPGTIHRDGAEVQPQCYVVRIHAAGVRPVRARRGAGRRGGGGRPRVDGPLCRNGGESIPTGIAFILLVSVGWQDPMET
jgi:hypothetical protein